MGAAKTTHTTSAQAVMKNSSSDAEKGRGQQQTTFSSLFVSTLVETIIVFTAALLVVFTATRFQIFLDEGIYTHGAGRVLSGQEPFRNWLVLTGPGTFFLYAVWFKLFGSSVAAAHALLAIEVSAICTSTYLIAAKLGNRLGGLTAVCSFLGLLTVFPHRLYVNHRWDSACCVLLSMMVLLRANENRPMMILAGVLAGAAAVFTPPVLLVAIAVFVVLLFSDFPRHYSLWFAVGALAAVAATAAFLAGQCALGSMLTSFRWVGTHYSQANRVPYGFVAPDIGVSDSDISLLRRFGVYVPAVLPVLAMAIWVWAKIRRRKEPISLNILLAAGLALAAACYPRVASNNLLFAAPLLVGFLIVMAANFFQPKTYRLALLTVTTMSLVGVFWSITGQPPSERVDSQLGEVKTSPRNAQNIRFATATINPGDSLFVYPYQPIWYSLTGGVNPTRFDFLQPGMMTLEEETLTLSELTAHPPDWVIWHNLPPQTVLAIWPHSDPATLHFHRIEQFIRTRYSQVRPPDSRFRYAIALFHRIG